jgi:hypothetical protein
MASLESALPREIDAALSFARSVGRCQNMRLCRLISIELATGRVGPLADKGLLDPPNCVAC